MNRMRFTDKVVIVTGGASGIGEATVRAFALEGAKVVIADFADAGQKLAGELHAKGCAAFFVKIDVRSETDTQNMVEETVKQFGRIDVLFANAGIGEGGPVAELSLDSWQKTIDINLTGVFLSNKYVISQMLKQESGGVIVNCGSIHSFVGKCAVAAYSAAKGGGKATDSDSSN